MDEEILKTLLKKATGYSHDEVQEEFSANDGGDFTLLKRKVTTKYYPPDSVALKTYLDLSVGKDIEKFSDRELKLEKARLLRELKKEEARQKKQKIEDKLNEKK